jgi:hypothetical protein
LILRGGSFLLNSQLMLVLVKAGSLCNPRGEVRSTTLGKDLMAFLALDLTPL